MAVIIVSNEIFAYAPPSCAYISNRNRNSFSGSLLMLRASPTNESQICKYEGSRMETGSFGCCHSVVHKQNPHRAVKTRTVKNSYHSYLGGADLFCSVEWRMQRDKVQQEYYSVLAASVINTKEEGEETDRMMCKLIKGIYWADYSKTKICTGLEENMGFKHRL